jgi:hypothetical protein
MLERILSNQSKLKQNMHFRGFSGLQSGLGKCVIILGNRLKLGVTTLPYVWDMFYIIVQLCSIIFFLLLDEKYNRNVLINILKNYGINSYH